MNLDEALLTFIVESRELLEEMESALLTLGEAGQDSEAVNAIFRAAHTIKGSAGLFGLDHIVEFTHVLESVLDDLRSGQITHDAQMVALLLSCRDFMGSLITGLEAGQYEHDSDSALRAGPLLAQLSTYLRSHSTSHAVTTQASVQTQPVTPVAPALVPIDASANDNHWHISVRFGADVLRNGMDPLSFVRYLHTLGDVVSIATVADALPTFESMDPESCHLGLEIGIRTDADRATIENVFEFVIDECELHLLPPGRSLEDCAALVQASGMDAARMGAMLLQCGTVTPEELDVVLDHQEAASAVAVASDTEVDDVVSGLAGVVAEAKLALIAEPATHESQNGQAPKAKGAKSQDSASLRVDASRLDQLIDLLGELTIAAAGASLVARRSRNAELEECTSTLTNLVEEVRDTALQLRMVRIGATFNRFQRVVHDLSREIGKDIALAVSGEDTELDKTLVEKLTDPLTHMVRNAMDHGIESPEARVAAGKAARGTVSLNAYHDSGNIVIEVSDDGAGLNRDKIFAKAVERGLVEAEQRLSDNEIFELIFEPGFSTADQVTNLSGRGVGMDVVKRNITALRGSIGVSSVAGHGTKIAVRLPLTLAIIDGFMVSVDKSVFTIPLDMIEECIEFNDESGQDFTDLRGQVLPFIRLRQLFGFDTTVPRRQSVVVVRHAGHRAGLIVDTLLGEFQTVIKPLSPIFAQVRCISGSTILGSGDVALILDIPALFSSFSGDSTSRTPYRGERAVEKSSSVNA